MLNKQYLLDTNCFVIPGRYYLQDIFPSFWQKMQQLIENHTVVVHETVLQEILPYKDELANWLENVPNYEPVKMDKKVLAKFIELSKWARSSEQNYTAQAISYFESNDNHAFLGGNEAVFNLKGEMTKGNKKHFRKKDRKLISDWIKEYNTEIRNNWNNIENGEKVCKIQPHTK